MDKQKLNNWFIKLVNELEFEFMLVIFTVLL